MTSTTRAILVFGQLTEIECEDELCGECSCEDEESGCCSMFGGRMRHAPEHERYRLKDCKNSEMAAANHRPADREGGGR